MKLYRKEEKKDVNKIIEGVKAAYGNPNPAKTHGFAGTFLYSLGDVYLSDRIWDWAGVHREWKEFIDGCITRFYREDYGDISSRDQRENIESRYFGNGSYMFARYCFNDICIKKLYKLFISGLCPSFLSERFRRLALCASSTITHS